MLRGEAALMVPLVLERVLDKSSSFSAQPVITQFLCVLQPSTQHLDVEDEI